MQQFPSMNGWNFREMFFLYALWMCGHELHNTLFFTVVSVPEYVREGRFDRFLVRPLDTLFQVLTVPQQIVPDGLVLAIATLAVATPVAGVRVDWVFVLFVPLIVIGGALIDLGISLGDRDLLVLVRSRRHAALGRDVARARLHAIPDQHLHARRSHRAGIRAAVCFHELLSGDVFLAEGRNRSAPQSGGRPADAGDRAWRGSRAAYAFWRVGLRHYQGTGS